MNRSALLKKTERVLHLKRAERAWKKLYLGFDLGTANLVIVAINEKGEPVSAVTGSSQSTIKDGVLVDYWGATQGMRRCLDDLKEKLGVEDLPETDILGAAAYPPGIDRRTAQACANVVESLGLECHGLYEEPTAAGAALNIRDGAIVDIGGGTTGISVLQDGEVVYTADEPTGGEHMTLVVSGALKVSFEEAERHKCDRSEQQSLFPVVKPVLEKMATIVRRQLEDSGYLGKVPIILAGGGGSFCGAEKVMNSVIGHKVTLADHPLLVTPTGIAVKLWKESMETH